MSALSFEILRQDKETHARLGLIKTRRGDIQTPYLVPVATLGSVRALGSDDLAGLGVQCTLANTYHLHLKPGDELIKRLGGLHRFMGFDRPLFTDSGGFQAFSLGFAREHNISKIGNIFPQELQSRGDQAEIYQDYRKKYEDECAEEENGCSIGKGYGEKEKRKPKAAKKENLTRITDEGISFKSLADGAWHFLNAEKSMKIQSDLGSDIIMAFDECTSPLSDYHYTRKAMLRSHNWAEESIRHHDKSQALYGIIQGGWFEDLRLESTEAISAQPFDGIAIGGSLGNSKQDMHQVLDWTVPRLDSDRPRHLLGIGEIDDIFECVARGIDTFDCVSPTRIARRGSLLLSPQAGGSQENKFRINIKNSVFKEDSRPADPNCTCPTCRTYSRAYLRHLYVSRELSYFRLATLHNLHFMLRFMEEIRESLRTGSFAELKNKWLRRV
ncbi:MAG: tRNA guanosine(34) transglycosylase Tgt [Methanotrichaceae archaeon]|nr:tRNA guanosine(34) transglycosylase Tgt [Methanotrichaceae archaeon]